MPQHLDVLVVTGAGGMGIACARRLGAGTRLVLADVSEDVLDREVAVLEATGLAVTPVRTDVSDPSSVAALAEAAAALGAVRGLVHTAGLSPVQASAAAVLAVDLVGTALMLDAFAEVIAPGGAGVFVASMAGAMAPFDADLEARLASTPTASLLELPELAAVDDAALAYMYAKRANQIHVRAASVRWGHRGARVNSVSPGIIATPMGAAELESPNGPIMCDLIAGSGCGLIGSPEEVARAAEFLLGSGAGFVTGTDLLVDGGATAAVMTPQR
jgi:NAD(P)-dependent dehydrogenase (short-subunit alcohol dehydrogenase family)